MNRSVRFLLVALALLGWVDLAVAQPAPPSVPAPPPAAVEVLTEPVPERPLPWLISGELGLGGGGMYGDLIPVGFGNRPGLFPIPAARLDGLINPRVTVGYDFWTIPGRVSATWEAYAGRGEAILLGFDPLASLFMPVMAGVRRNRPDLYLPALMMRDTLATSTVVRSRANVNLVDVAYSTVLWEAAPGTTNRFVLRGKIGGRIGTFFSDDQADGSGYHQSATNYYTGAGPVLGLRLEVPREQGLFLGVDGGVLFGRDRQTFRELDLFARPRYRERVVTGHPAVEFLSAEAGWAGGTSLDGRVRWGAGVRFTQFFGVGDLGPSRLDFQALTAFARIDYRF